MKNLKEINVSKLSNKELREHLGGLKVEFEMTKSLLLNMIDYLDEVGDKFDEVDKELKTRLNIKEEVTDGTK